MSIYSAPLPPPFQTNSLTIQRNFFHIFMVDSSGQNIFLFWYGDSPGIFEYRRMFHIEQEWKILNRACIRVH